MRPTLEALWLFVFAMAAASIMGGFPFAVLAQLVDFSPGGITVAAFLCGASGGVWGTLFVARAATGGSR